MKKQKNEETVVGHKDCTTNEKGTERRMRDSQLEGKTKKNQRGKPWQRGKELIYLDP